MNFLNRLKFYLIGFSLGLFLIYTLFKDREWDWLPENKVKNFILKNPLKINLKKYIIEYNNSSALFNVSFEDTLCRLISIDNMIFRDHYEPEYLDTIVFIDRYNLLMKFDKMEKKFTKYFISKVKKYGLNSDDISKNLKNFKVDWKKSNPFSIINPKYIGTISISNLQYEISLETGNNKLRFKDFREN